MNPRRRMIATLLALAATTGLSGCYAGYGGSAGYGGYTRAGGYSGPSSHYRGRVSGGVEELLLYAGFYAGAALIAGAFELVDRCVTYCAETGCIDDGR